MQIFFHLWHAFEGEESGWGVQICGNVTLAREEAPIPFPFSFNLPLGLVNSSLSCIRGGSIGDYKVFEMPKFLYFSVVAVFAKGKVSPSHLFIHNHDHDQYRSTRRWYRLFRNSFRWTVYHCFLYSVQHHIHDGNGIRPTPNF